MGGGGTPKHLSVNMLSMQQIEINAYSTWEVRYLTGLRQEDCHGNRKLIENSQMLMNEN